MRRQGLAVAFGVACLGAALLSGCHGGGAANTITIEIIPPTTGTSVDVGTTAPLNFTAALGEDTQNKGVTWKISGSSCSGTGCGTLSNQQSLSVSYTPPAAPLPSSAALSVTLTATSVEQTSVTQTATINVEPLPTFTTTSCNPPIPTGLNATCGLPGASNGQSYNEPVQIAGGVQPYTFSIASATVNGTAQPLSTECLGLTVTQTTSVSTAVAGKPCNAGVATVTFIVQVTDSGGAAPVTQQYSTIIAAAPALSITRASLNGGSLNAEYSDAVTKSGGVPAITWRVSSGALPPGLSLNATNGQIAGVPTTAGTYNFTVAVSDSSILPNSPPPGYHNQTKTQAYSITIRQPGLLSITTPSGPLAAGITATGYSAAIQASGGVQFSGGGSAYAWSVTQGQLPPGLTLAGTQSGNAVISGVPTVIGTYSFTIQVRDAEVTPQTATAAYSIAVSGGQDNNSLLLGSYSFIFRGFDKDGWVAMIGTLTSDGNGNISGAEVINRGSGVAPAASVTGTYAIDSATSGTSNGASGDGRGVMELTTTINQQSVTAEYELTLESDGSVQFIQDHDYPTTPAPPTNPDTFATHGQGVMKPVLSGGFSAATFNGNYAFELTGEDTNKKPDALAGFIHADGSSSLTPGTADFNDAGTYHGAQLLSGEFSFPGSVIGAAELTLENPQVTLQFEYVFVSQSDLYFIEVDSNPSAANAPTLYRLSGEMILQQPNTQFGSGSLAPAAVASGSGVGSSGNALASAGLLSATAPATTMVCDGGTQNTFSWDQNDGGALSQLSLQATCTVNPNNGRVAFNWIQPPAPAPMVTPPFAAAYLVDTGTGFLIGSDATVTTGLIELQTSPAPFSNSSVSGAFAIGAPFIAEPGANSLSGQVVADGAGNLTGTVDEADASGASQTLNQPFAATISAIGANGRGTMTTTAPVPAGFPTDWIFYIVSPGRIRAIPADTSNQHPQLIFLGPATL